jgi:hypothetical protein
MPILLARILTRRAAAIALACAGALSLTAPAVAATAPSAFTGSVSALGPTSASLNGTVNPNGTATSWRFDYGTASSYGTQTSSQSAGSGTSDSSVSASLTGLLPGTTYHYRLEATSSAGTTDGSDGIFTTSSPPGAVTDPATNLGAGSATLNGLVQPNGQQTSYVFDYGTTTSYGSSTPISSAGSGSSAIAVSASVSGLHTGQTSHFRLVATSAAGTTDGPDMSVTLGPPPIVTTSAASSLSGSGAQLNGTVNPHGVQTSWYFEYGTTTSYGSTTSSVGAGSGSKALNVSSILTGLAPATVYHFRLVATNQSGTSTGSDRSFESSVPPAVQTGSAEGSEATSVILTGSVNPKGTSTSWSFQYGTSTSYGTTSRTSSAGSGTATRSVSVVISNLQPGTTYHYRIVATSKAGTSDGGDVTFTTPAAVTLVAESSQSVYGRAVTLQGAVSGAAKGVTVNLLAEPLGQTTFTTLATVVSGSGGAWSYQARPALATTYEASTAVGASAPVTIGVRPAITLRLITGARFLCRVVAGTSFAGRSVKLQRLLPLGGWKTVARARLNSRSSVIFTAKLLPTPRTTIRVAMSINQAGRGYLAGFSRTLTYTRG